ncbi:MAG TPA: ATP-binding protein, partial [Steroidobacteraceae bacterium]
VTTRLEGMGLGLSIARSIITAHRGRIWAEDNVAQGAIFHFILPVDTDTASSTPVLPDSPVP